MRSPRRLKEVAKTGLAGRAYPLEIVPRTGGDGGGEQAWTGGMADVRWRIEIDGHPPYEFQDSLDLPGWINPGHRGRKVWNVRWRPSHGIQKDLGVPCRVDPGDQEFIAIDWDAAYEEHQAAWNRLDAQMRQVSRRRGGIDNLIDKVTLRGAPDLDSAEAAELDRAIDENREAAARAEAAASIPSEPVRSLMAERDGLQAQMNEAKRLKKTGRKVPARVLSCEETGAAVSGLPVWAIRAELREDGAPPRTIEQHLALAKFSVRGLRAGKDVTARVDPDDPSQVSLI